MIGRAPARSRRFPRTTVHSAPRPLRRAAFRPSAQPTPYPRRPVLFAQACAMGLEGIVSERANSSYRSGRDPPSIVAARISELASGVLECRASVECRCARGRNRAAGGRMRQADVRFLGDCEAAEAGRADGGLELAAGLPFVA